ncbi:MAG: hypothetical protein GY936_12690, partial [Ignavibacteriae bacterium]|nr:hypothetical protein [Ignavibacteriota bacterium]
SKTNPDDFQRFLFLGYWNETIYIDGIDEDVYSRRAENTTTTNDGLEEGKKAK